MPGQVIIDDIGDRYSSQLPTTDRQLKSYLISIIMPTHNRVNVILAAIESIAAQTYPNWELIIIDDGSTDNTDAIISRFSDPRIIYKKLDSNHGVAHARNIGLQHATGKYIAYLDSDNRMHKDFLTIMHGRLEENPQFDCAYSAQKGIRIRHFLGKSFKKPVIKRYRPFSRSLLENGSYIDLNCFVHKRELYQKLGGFDESLKRLVDWDLILRYTQDQSPLQVDEMLSEYVFDKSNRQISGTVPLRDSHLIIRTKLSAIEIDSKVFDEVPNPKSFIHGGLWLRKLTYDRFVGGDFRLFNRLGNKRLPSPNRKMTIIIPSYNVLNYLRICVRAIETYTNRSFYDLVIVDNNSDAYVQKYLTSLEDKGNAKVIRNSRNLGFTAAVNQGIEASGTDTDIVLMNNDAMVTEGWLEALQEVTVDFKDAGIIAPRQVLPPHTRTMKKHVPDCWPSNELDVNLSAHHKNVLNPSLDPLKGFVELSFVPFFCVYITRDCINRVGLLDSEKGPHYRSDRLYCDAVRQQKMQIVYTPHCKVYHFLQKSSYALKRRSRSEFRKLFR